jgi:hypothetical protein
MAEQEGRKIEVPLDVRVCLHASCSVFQRKFNAGVQQDRKGNDS